MSGPITGEAVRLDLRPARVASRSLAFAIDGTLQVILLLGVTIATSAITTAVGADDAILAALSLVSVLVVILGYPVVSEVVGRGRTLGMAAFGLRVVRDDGGTERFRHALVRALFGVIEIWVTAGTIAIIASLSSRDGKRLGDQFAGTLVVLERTPGSAPVVDVPAPWLVPWLVTTTIARVPDDLLIATRTFLQRRGGLDPAVRSSMAVELATRWAPYVAPPAPRGTSAEDFVVAVAAERRRRDSLGAAAPPVPPAPPAPPAPAPPTPAPPTSSRSTPPEHAAGPPAPAEGPGFAPPA